MMRRIKAFWNDERGVTAMEYGMIASLVAVAIIVTLGNVGVELNRTFSKIEQAIAQANAKAP